MNSSNERENETSLSDSHIESSDNSNNLLLLIEDLHNLFLKVEDFRSKLTGNGIDSIADKATEFILLIETTKLLLNKVSVTDREELIKKLGLAQSRLENVERESNDSLLMAFTLISDSIWNVKNACENYYDVSEKRRPAKIKETATKSYFPAEIVHHIYSYLPMKEQMKTRKMSKRLRSTFDSELSSEKVIIGLIEVGPSFAEFYQTTDDFKLLRDRFLIDKYRLNTFEIICHALTTPNIYEIDIDLVTRAISDFQKMDVDESLRKEFDSHIAKELYIMFSIIKIQEATSLAQENELIEDAYTLLTARNGTKYINLQNADLTKFNLSEVDIFGKRVNLVGAYFKHASFKKFDYPVIFSPFSFYDPETFKREVNNLHNQIKGSPKERNFRLYIAENILPVLEKSTEKHSALSQLPRAYREASKDLGHRQALEYVEYLLKHPIVEHRHGKEFKEKVNRTTQKFFGKKLLSSSIESRLLRVKEKLEQDIKMLERSGGPGAR